MSLSPLVVEWVAAYEQEHGRKPTETTVQIAQHIAKVGAALQEQGAKDAREGRKQCRSEEFPALVCRAFHMSESEDHEFVASIAELWESDYLEGYQEGGAA